MRRMNFRNQLEEWSRFRKGFLNCLLWWGIGGGIGLLFAIALSQEMQSALGQHLETGVGYLMSENPAQLTYFFKRCLTYTQLLLLVWTLEYFTYGYIGVRILLLVRGFLYGFGQVAWLSAYQIRGLWLGLMAYWPHNLLWIVVVAWLEWMMRTRARNGHMKPKQLAVITICMIPLLAVIEAYATPALFRYFM